MTCVRRVARRFGIAVVEECGKRQGGEGWGGLPSCHRNATYCLCGPPALEIQSTTPTITSYGCYQPPILPPSTRAQASHHLQSLLPTSPPHDTQIIFLTPWLEKPLFSFRFPPQPVTPFVFHPNFPSLDRYFFVFPLPFFPHLLIRGFM